MCASPAPALQVPRSLTVGPACFLSPPPEADMCFLSLQMIFLF